MTDQALDELVRRVLLDTARQEYGELMKEAPGHDFTPAFEKKMQKLLRRAKHPARYQLIQAAACLLLALLLTGCAVLAVSPEAREVFAGWVREVQEMYQNNWYVYRYTGQHETQKTANADSIGYHLTWIPEGYTFDEEIPMYGQYLITYCKDGNRDQVFMFGYAADLPENQSVYVGADGTERFEAEVNGRPADIHIDNKEGSSNVIVWSGEAGTIFYIAGTLTKDELIRVAESVTAVPSEPRPTWVPEGYERFDEEPGARGSIAYRNQENEQIHFRKHPYTTGTFPQIWISMTEGDMEKQVLVNGQPADLYLAPEGGISFLLWADEDFQSAFMLNGPLTEEEIIRMAESLQIAPVRQAPHRPSWLPEGYSFASQSNGGGRLDLQYNAESKEPILFRYWLEGRADKLKAEMEEALVGLTPQSIQVNGLPAQLYADSDGCYHLVWTSEEPEGTFWITAALTPEELIRIAEGVGVDAAGMPAS
jgi:hypothetical protein